VHPCAHSCTVSFLAEPEVQVKVQLVEETCGRKALTGKQCQAPVEIARYWDQIALSLGFRSCVWFSTVMSALVKV